MKFVQDGNYDKEQMNVSREKALKWSVPRLFVLICSKCNCTVPYVYTDTPHLIWVCVKVCKA